MSNRTYHERHTPVHGFSPVRTHPLYNTWAAMLSRCTNPAFTGYANYGGRGVTVAKRWEHFANFAEDMWPKPEGGFTLERKDNSKGYSKSNCTWATRTEQCVNRRTFSNNTSGFTGVVHCGTRFTARFDFEHVRYLIGRYDSAEQAATAREDFLDKFFTDRESAIAGVTCETLWCTSTTGIRGITPHADGGFIARATKDGVRHYLGYFKDLESARDARTRFIEG